MAKQPTVNIYSLLQQDEPVAAAASSGKAGQPSTVPGGAQTPAEKAAARAKANAEKDAAKEAANKRAQADAAAAALVGPLDGFITQKTTQQKKADKDAQKKLSRQDYEKSAKDGQSPDGRRRDGEKKPRGDGSYDRKPGARDGQPRRDNHHVQVGTGNKPPKRDGFDKHSAGKTPKQFQNKKGGDGAGNWGNPVADASKGVTETAAWGDEGEVKAQPEAGASAWGDEGEPKAEEPKADAEAEQADQKPREPKEAAWDDEGFGKMTLQEYQEKVAAARAAELAAKVGKTVERRAAEPVDLSKFVEKEVDAEEAKFLKKAVKKEKKQGAAAARTGETPLALNEVFALNRGGRGGFAGQKRGPRPEGEHVAPAGDRPPRGPGAGGRGGRGGGAHNKVNQKAFPELAPKPQHLK